jgi:hypothetical protein
MLRIGVTGPRISATAMVVDDHAERKGGGREPEAIVAAVSVPMVPETAMAIVKAAIVVTVKPAPVVPLKATLVMTLKTALAVSDLDQIALNAGGNRRLGHLHRCGNARRDRRQKEGR